MAGHFKLTYDKQVFARGTYAQMEAARSMHTKSKGKLMGVVMQIEADAVDYPYRGNDQPALPAPFKK